MALPQMKPIKTYLQCLLLLLVAIASVPRTGMAQTPDLIVSPSPPSPSLPLNPSLTAPKSETITQGTTPMDFLDQPEGVINCVATGTSNTVPWDHRFTYWLSGIAEFDEQGTMRPISVSQSRDWLLTITNSRFPSPSSHPLTILDSQTRDPGFSFPAVSPEEWERIGKQPSNNYTTAFSYEDASHGLYVAIRNTEAVSTTRQMFQVVHYLADDVIIRSAASPCFVGPRPPLPSEIGQLLDDNESHSHINL